MEFGLVLETFPKLDQVPEAIAEIFMEMIQCFNQNKAKTSKLQVFQSKQLFMVNDNKGKIFCLFKKYQVEKSAKTEASIYLLDHASDGHRSTSTTCFGLSGVPPTIFIRTKDEFGCLIKHVDDSIQVARAINSKVLKVLPKEIQKVCISHIRFGNVDAHSGNTLATQDGTGYHQLTVIDNEECFSNGAKLRSLWWEKEKGADVGFLPEMAKYVRELDVDKDIKFLRRCGWDVPTPFLVFHKIFTQFLKKAVEYELKPNELAILALGQFKRFPNLNLNDMVSSSDRKRGDENFVNEAYKKIEEGLMEYVWKTQHRRINQKGKGKNKK